MNESKDFDSGLITLAEFAKKMKKPESTIRTWKRRGDLPSFLFKKIGGDVFIKRKRYEKWVEEED
jgi:hypothetical protein